MESPIASQSTDCVWRSRGKPVQGGMEMQRFKKGVAIALVLRVPLFFRPLAGSGELLACEMHINGPRLGLFRVHIR
jgi:hypothetical protein